MRAIVQRVVEAKVTVGGDAVAETGPGLVLMVGAHKDDTEENAVKLAKRIATLRVFNDAEGKMNLSFADAIQHSGYSTRHSPGMLAISNFTVYADASSRRPSFAAAAPYERGEELFAAFVEALRAEGVPVETGTYGAMMGVSFTNDGPVTLVLDC